MSTGVDCVSLQSIDLPYRELWTYVYLGHIMRMLANRHIFRETEYGSDVFVNNRMSSILLSSHEKNLRGFIGFWYEYCPSPS